MAERLVILKTLRQRGIEGWLALALPPLAALALRFLAGGPIFLGMLIVFFSYFLPQAIGSALAARFGWGAWVTPDERRTRLIEQMLGLGPVRTAVWMALGYTLWMASVFATIADFRDRPEVLLLSGIALAGGCLAAASRWMSLRRFRTLYAAADAEKWPEQTLRGWLPGYLKIHYPCLLGGAALGLGVSWFMSYPAAMVVLLAGFWGGLALESVLLNRLRVPKRPLLWTQIGFGGACGIALLQMGIPLAIVLGLMPVALHHPEKLEMVAFAIGGLVFGMTAVLMQWAVARLGNIGPRKGGA